MLICQQLLVYFNIYKQKTSSCSVVLSIKWFYNLEPRCFNAQKEENAWKFDVQMTRIAHLDITGYEMVYVLQCLQNDTQTLLNV